MERDNRQIYTFGMECMSKLIKMKVLLVGCRGLGVETAKNIILAGPASVAIYDPNMVTWGDLSSNFYCRPEHVGVTTRAAACVTSLSELNPYVQVSVLDHLSTSDCAQYNVVCVTEIFENIDKMIELNEFCRERKIGFIMSQTYGPSGFAFVDYGYDFEIIDTDGEMTKQFIVANITQSNPAIVTVHEEKRHIYQTGDHVVFREVQGMVEMNDIGPTQIEFIDGFSFKVLVDSTNFIPYTGQGQVENMKVSKRVSYHSLKQSLHDPIASSQFGMLNTPDLRCIGRSD